MKVFRYSDADHLVAEDVADALAVLVETYGGTAEDFAIVRLEEVPADKRIEIWCNAEGVPDEPEGEGNQIVQRAAGEWATANGRGLLCTNEY